LKFFIDQSSTRKNVEIDRSKFEPNSSTCVWVSNDYCRLVYLYRRKI